MYLTSNHFRSIIFYNFRRGLSRQECINELKCLFGDKGPSFILASKHVYKIVRGNESWICAYELETKQQFIELVIEPEPHPTKVVREENTSKQLVACFFCITGHVATVPL